LERNRGGDRADTPTWRGIEEVTERTLQEQIVAAEVLAEGFDRAVDASLEALEGNSLSRR
jgi:hypothetical protein